MVGIDDVMVKDIVTDYVSKRDSMRIQHHTHDVTHLEFIAMINAHVERLERELPAFTLAQLEGFVELVNAQLATRRLREAAYRK